MAKHVISFEFFFLAFSAMMPHGVSLKNPKNDKNIGKFLSKSNNTPFLE